MSLSLPRLCAIIDAAQAGMRAPAALAEVLFAAGVSFIQYRDKRAPGRDLFENGRRMRACLPPQVVFILNDRADVARAVGAGGVHLGQDDLPVELARRVLGPEKVIGYSTHNLAQVAEAERSSADYIAFGPMFPTSSKENPDPVVGLEGLREARKLTRKPLVAIGGIRLENACAVIEAGADSVAVIGGLLHAPDLGLRAREFVEALQGAKAEP